MGDVDLLVAAITRDLVDGDRWTEWPGGWPGEIEVCLVDSIYSANARYGSPAKGDRPATGVHKVIGRLRELRGDGRLDDLSALVATLDAAAPPVLGNSQNSPGTSTLKEINVARIAEAFLAVDVRTSTELDSYLVTAGRQRWPRHPELGRIAGVGEQTWEYFLMLAGHTGVKADRMIRRYVARALGSEDIAPADASALVRAAAATPAIDRAPHQLDHAIWAFERAGSGSSGSLKAN